MNSNEVDILENIADVLTSKFKKELILNLQPYTERIRDGEKYQQVILKLLESLPEYVELREKYDRVVEENLKLKGGAGDSVEANITLDLSEKRDEGNQMRRIDLTNDIGVVCQDDKNLVLDKSSGEETDEERDGDRDSDKDKKTVVYKDNYLESKFDAVDKPEKEGEQEEVEVTDDEEEEEEEGEEEEVEVTDDEEEEEEEEDERERGDIPAEEEEEEGEEEEVEVTDDEEEEVEVTDDEEEEEVEVTDDEEEEVEVTDDEEEEEVKVVEQPKVEEKPKKSGKKPTNERKVPIK